MNDNTGEINQRLQQLRTRGEAQLIHVEPTKEPLPAALADELLHELRTHQIELEMQNEALRLTQAALEKSRAHYIELYDFAPVGYLTINAEGIITEINLTAAKLVGVDRNNLVNRRFAKFIVDDYKDLWYRHFILAKQTAGNHGCELPFCHENGSTLYLHLDCLCVSTDAAAPLMRITLTDITERKKAEEALRITAAAFETQEGIIVADANKVILRVNQSFTRITGYSAEYALGKAPFFLRSGLHDKAFYEALWGSVLRNGYWHGELWNKRKNGDIYPVLQTITAVSDASGAITHYVGSFMDITAQKKAEMILLDTRERLQHQVASTQEELEKIKAETAAVTTALNVMLKYRETDKSEAQNALSTEVEATILPFLKKLKGMSAGRVQSIRLLDILETNLQLLVKSYGCADNLNAAYQKLTPIEAQVASMIRQGLPTKVIATTLNIASGTVSIHRKHIRKKLCLDSKAINLHSYLLSLTE